MTPNEPGLTSPAPADRRSAVAATHGLYPSRPYRDFLVKSLSQAAESQETGLKRYRGVGASAQQHGRCRPDVDLAPALTYYGVLALFPAVLVLVSILGLLGKSTTQQVLNNLGQVAPGGVHTFLTNVVTQVQGKAGAAGVAGIIGLVIAVWSASSYVAAFMRASNAIYDVDEGRPIWKTGPIRLFTTVALVVMLVIAAAIVVLTGPIANQVGT